MYFIGYSIFHITLRKPEKKKKKLKNVVINLPLERSSSNGWILSAWNDISCETIQKSFKSYALRTTLVGDDDDQIHCFKPEENQFVAILDDIAEATPTEMLIDEDEEGDEEIDVLLRCII